ncbi:MAG: hypothetical protein OXU45_00680 [Candidatus Melainabacteria bacterium]|nr:hypothetical protein [Candidatus Melainabacteria bacterium]
METRQLDGLKELVTIYRDKAFEATTLKHGVNFASRLGQGDPANFIHEAFPLGTQARFLLHTTTDPQELTEAFQIVFDLIQHYANVSDELRKEPPSREDCFRFPVLATTNYTESIITFLKSSLEALPEAIPSFVEAFETWSESNPVTGMQKYAADIFSDLRTYVARKSCEASGIVKAATH